MRCGLEMDAHFRALARQPFARAHVKRHARPAPIIQRQFERRKSRRGGVRPHVRLVTVSPELVVVESPRPILPYDTVTLGIYRADRLQHLHGFVA